MDQLMDGWMNRWMVASVVTKRHVLLSILFIISSICLYVLYMYVYSWSIKDKAIWIADELAKNNNRHQRYQSSAVSDGNPEVTAKDQSQDSGSRSDDDNNITHHHHHHHQTETLVLDRLKSVDGLDVGEGGSNILEMNMVDCLLLTKHYLLGKEGRHQ